MLLRALVAARVAEREQDEASGATGNFKRRHRILDADLVARAAERKDGQRSAAHEHASLARARVVADPLTVETRDRRGHQHVHRAAHRVRRRVAKHAFGGRVPADDPT